MFQQYLLAKSHKENSQGKAKKLRACCWCSVSEETNNTNVPYLISAPTMRVPSDVSSTVNAYLAFKGILQAEQKFNKSAEKRIESILCPGLGTGEGKMAPESCARQMHRAYEVCILNKYEKKGGLAGAVNDHLHLIEESP